MTDQIDGKQTGGRDGDLDRTRKTLQQDKLHRRAQSRGRDDTIDEDLEQERLTPGLNAGGDGEAGADPASTHSDGNSNT